jgi:outer membrane receptor protein involved in Fe transport
MKKYFNFVLFASFILSLTFHSALANSIIKGKITDAQSGLPLLNANVMIEGTSIGTTSDKEGNFRITNLPPGNYVVMVNYIGYQPYKESISFVLSKSLTLDIKMKPVILPGESVTVTARAVASKAVERETPIAFTNLKLKELKHNYTTGDLPELIQNVPGIWTSSAGMGESEIMLRGFPADKVRFMLNDIPMNEPEDQNVHWSNWASLANSVNSIEVQRGPGFSLYGAGAFGGTIQIETMGVSLEPGSVLRFSSGGYKRMGINSGMQQGKIYNPIIRNIEDVESAKNYTYSARLNSGSMFNGKLNMSLFLEYKTGDSYIYGTTYDGYSMGFEAESIFRRHKLRFSFFMSPQVHNQAFALQDIDLLKTLGREYNRRNHEWQENFYSKPFWSLKHKWTISNNSRLISNVFFTIGKGADQSIVNDIFNVQSGAVDYMSVSEGATIQALGMHAIYLYEKYDIKTTEFIPKNPDNILWGPGDDYHMFAGADIHGAATNLFTDNRDHSWQRRNRRDHNQFGFSTYFESEITNNLQFLLGSEGRMWKGHRAAEVWHLRFGNFKMQGRGITFVMGENITSKELQPLYDYDTKVNNFSSFGRFKYKPINFLTLQAGGQFAFSNMKVIENPIPFIDFGTFKYFENPLRTTADQVDTSGNKIFSTSDYKKTYSFLTPWLGANLNISKNFNIFTNYAMSKKEPAILNWYDFEKGPIQKNENNTGLKPESAQNYEVGIGFHSLFLKSNINYYYTIYENKIESVVDINDRYQTLNAGKAIYQGLELEFRGNMENLDFAGSATIAKNRWQQMDVQEIFGTNADEVVGKVVPFSPERMFTFLCGYKFMPYPKHQYRLGLKLNYWDEYYGTYTNEYKKHDGSFAKAKLPSFLDLSANLSFTLRLQKVDVTLRLDANNIFNRSDNFVRAQYTIDYTRTDDLAGEYNWYVLQAPLFNIFFTTEFAIH